MLVFIIVILPYNLKKMTKLDLTSNEFDPYFWKYIDKLSEAVFLRDSFRIGKDKVTQFFKSIPYEKHDFTYQKGKWTCKEVLQHLVDTERIFQYRCFRIARNDKTALAGYDQNEYVEPSLAQHKTMEELISEFIAVRDSSISFLKSISNESLKNVGVASNGNMSARAAAFIITGHEIWHLEILKERYLSSQ